MITVALSKGKLLRQSLRILAEAGYPAPSDFNRTLRLEIPGRGIRLLLTKDFDTPLYVEQGAADLGICGRDVLLERREIGVYEIADLGFGGCRIALAGCAGVSLGGPLPNFRVATKYPNIASDYFISRKLPYELIRVAGAVELACVSGLADLIVDLVDTGRTLDENGLRIIEVIGSSSARLIANRASYALKRISLEDMARKVKHACRQKKD